MAGDNKVAWYLWRRAEHVGMATALEMISLELSPREAEYLLNKLALLEALAAGHRRKTAQQGGAL